MVWKTNKMRSQFLQKLIEQFPNDYQLGQAIRKYHQLRSGGKIKPDCEKVVLGTKFDDN